MVNLATYSGMAVSERRLGDGCKVIPNVSHDFVRRQERTNAYAVRERMATSYSGLIFV